MAERKFILVLFLICIGTFRPASAQTTKLQQGINNFMDGSYYKSLEIINQAISTDRSMTREMFAQAYYYRGLTYIRLYNEVYSGDNSEEKKKYRDALLQAYRDFKASFDYDDGNLWKQIDLEVNNLHHPLLQEGLTSLNTHNDVVFNGKADEKELKRAEDYLVAAHEIRETYLVCDLIGQVYLNKGMKEEAAVWFSRSEQLYSGHPPEEPDFLMAYVFYRLSAIHHEKDNALALQDNQRGLKFLETEYSRFIALRDKIPPARATLLQDQYELALQDMNNLKLDLYLTGPDQYVEALHVFEEQLAKDPENVEVLVGYGSLLEQSDKEKAIRIYKKAIEIQPDHAIAQYNLGALYYAKGKALLETAQKTADNQQYAILESDAMNEFRNARQYFEGALQADPSSLENVQALKTIAYILDDKPAYDKYKEIESRLNK